MNWVTLVLCNILIVPKYNPITPLISNLPRIFFSFHSVSLTCPGKWFILSLLRLIMGTTHAHTSDTWQYDIVGCSSSDLQQPPKRRNNISRCHTGIFHFKRFEEEKSCKRMLYAILHQVYRDQMGSISPPLLRLLLETNQRYCNCFFFRFFYLLWCGGENVRGDHFIAVIRRDTGSPVFPFILSRLEHTHGLLWWYQSKSQRDIKTPAPLFR